MIEKIKSPLVLGIMTALLSACGGGSSGTAIGGSGDSTRFAGVVVSADGRGVASAAVTLIDTDERVTTDESGAFDINSSFVSGTATFQIEGESGANARVSIDDPLSSRNRIDLSILFNQEQDSAQLLDLTMRTRMVRSCSPFFLNTRTIQQISPVKDGLICTLEVEFKKRGIPGDELTFELQHRGCSSEDPWVFSGISKTGTSGPGVGEIDFNFRNDQKHCVYRVIGPGNRAATIPISTQINTLRKEQFDSDN